MRVGNGIAANLGGDGSRHVIFGYPAGAAMSAGTAPEPRVGFFMDDAAATTLTADRCRQAPTAAAANVAAAAWLR